MSRERTTLEQRRLWIHLSQAQEAKPLDAERPRAQRPQGGPLDCHFRFGQRDKNLPCGLGSPRSETEAAVVENPMVIVEKIGAGLALYFFDPELGVGLA